VEHHALIALTTKPLLPIDKELKYVRNQLAELVFIPIKIKEYREGVQIT
tara:strand:- start:414 stop:560 length:147 start_codon:yes stop_codon:yes gene_type:complete